MLKHISESRLCIGFFVICLTLNLVLSSVGLRNSLLEVHEFRQLQTAFTARSFQKEGWSLAYPTPLFGPPWSVPMEFPLYQYAVAKLSTWIDAPLEVTGRVIALAFLYLSLPAFLSLAGCLGLARERRWLLPGLILLTPAYLYYSRTFMIESTALCASAWFLLGYVRALELRSISWLLASVAGGVAGALVKVTTLSVFLVVAAAYTLWLLQRQWRNREAGINATIARAFIATIPAVIAGSLWVRFSDSVKTSNPLSAYLSSASMSTFNFGTLAQRLSADFWQRISYHTQIALTPVFNLALVVLFTLLLGRGHRARASLLLLGFAAGPLVFANLYFVHDYYFYASGVFLLGALVLAWNQVLNLDQFSLLGRWAVIGVSAAAQLWVYFPGYFQAQRQPLDSPPELGSILSIATQPDDILLIFGQDWAARVPYFADRRAVMIPDKDFNNSDAISNVLDRIPPGRVTALVASGNPRKFPAALRPYLRRLEMRPDPILINDDSVLYLAESRMADALAQLEASPPKTFNFAAPSEDSSSGIPRLRILAPSITDEALLAMMSPRPVEIIYPFGLGLHVVDGRDAFNAHAPTDLIFAIPADATEIVAEFGILDAASAGKNRTDGVEFRVELVTADGRRTLHSRYLSPNERPEDAGKKRMRFSIPKDAEGQIWFRTLAGHTGSIAFAWAYWAKIEIR